jgi:hypothetical protein
MYRYGTHYTRWTRERDFQLLHSFARKWAGNCGYNRARVYNRIARTRKSVRIDVSVENAKSWCTNDVLRSFFGTWTFLDLTTMRPRSAESLGKHQRRNESPQCFREPFALRGWIANRSFDGRMPFMRVYRSDDGSFNRSFSVPAVRVRTNRRSKTGTTWYADGSLYAMLFTYIAN